ncbi:MAG: hypothetical protein GY795_11205 [Desulfobacterales bacterium]|nr:hypothetical protein [Desulfobacterales bacterium]
MLIFNQQVKRTIIHNSKETRAAAQGKKNHEKKPVAKGPATSQKRKYVNLSTQR